MTEVRLREVAAWRGWIEHGHDEDGMPMAALPEAEPLLCVLPLCPFPRRVSREALL